MRVASLMLSLAMCLLLVAPPALSAIPEDDLIAVDELDASLGRSTFNRRTGEQTFQLTLSNPARFAIAGPLWVAVTPSLDTIPVVDPDDVTDTGTALMRVEPDPILPGESVRLTIVVSNPTLARFELATQTMLQRVALPITLPALTGRIEAAADALTAGLGLALNKDRVFDDAVESGRVISQEPPAGAAIETGDPVQVVVSDGPAPRTVPELIGIPRGEAEARIETAGLALGNVATRDDATAPAEQVIDQNPTPGATRPPGSTVDLVVSLGPPLVLVPDLIGLLEEDAFGLLSALELTTGTLQTRASSEFPDGSVIEQDPAADTEVAAGTSVALTFSNGPELALVPDLIGLPLASAVQSLGDAGLGLGERADRFDPSLPDGLIAAQQPAPGSELATGSRVDITLSRGPLPDLPSVRIVAPPDFTLVSSPELTLTVEVGAAVQSLTVEGVPVPIADGVAKPTLTLHEGVNEITAVAATADGIANNDTIEVTLDTNPPAVVVAEPEEAAVVTQPSVVVTGFVNDIAVGVADGADPQVSVEGRAAAVANGSFVSEPLALTLGEQAITIEARDQAGNTRQVTRTLTRREPIGQRILPVSGDGQTGTVGEPLAEPLVVALEAENGTPVAGRGVRFEVTRGSGLVLDGAAAARSLVVTSDAAGLAAVGFELGSRAGFAAQQVSATAPGFEGRVVFSARSTPGPIAGIKSYCDDHQYGIVGSKLPEPLVAFVHDAAGNPIPGANVTFSLLRGSGTFEGAEEVVVTTNDSGMAATTLTLGMEVGPSVYVVAAAAGAGLEPAIFKATGMAPGPVQETRLSGIVLDNTDTPIPGATITIPGSPAAALTDAEGRFMLEDVPVGRIHLHVEADTTPREGHWTALEFELTTIAGVENRLGMPIHVLPIDDAGARPVSPAEDVVVTMDGVPGLTLEIAAGSAQCPDGSLDCAVSITQVHRDKVPMPFPGGVLPPLAWTVQPHGTLFDPPARLTLPNSDGLAPGTIVDLLSFDHDLGQFVSVGPASVSEDGLSLVSDPGFGITKSGWGGGPSPPPPPICASNCDDGNMCTRNFCRTGFCFTIFENRDLSNASPRDCRRTVCSTGVATIIDADNERPYQRAADDCKRQICREGRVRTIDDDSEDCSDDNLCTLGDACSAGQCTAGAQMLDCDDNRPCTRDSCDPEVGCENEPDDDIIPPQTDPNDCLVCRNGEVASRRQDQVDACADRVGEFIDMCQDLFDDWYVLSEEVQADGSTAGTVTCDAGSCDIDQTPCVCDSVFEAQKQAPDVYTISADEPFSCQFAEGSVSYNCTTACSGLPPAP